MDVNLVMGHDGVMHYHGPIWSRTAINEDHQLPTFYFRSSRNTGYVHEQKST